MCDELVDFLEGAGVEQQVYALAGRELARLERVCRYLLRPPVATERVALTEAGQVQLELRHPWADGTTHVQFDPVAFLERLAVLVPRPRVNLILYSGVLAARAAWRPEIVPGSERGETGHESAGGPDAPEATPRGTPRGYRWAELLWRTFGIDVLACPRCGGRLVLIALIERSDVITRLLGHLRLPSELPRPAPARSRGQAAGLDPMWADDVRVWERGA